MKKVLVLICLTLVSCNYQSKVSKELDCTPESYKNLELVSDFKNVFKVQLPDHWKTNLYYDSNQSSIFSADTTKQLTETYMIDVTHVSKQLKLDDAFSKKYQTSLLNEKLVETTSYEFDLHGKKSFYSRALGKKGKYAYQICNVFIKIDSDNYVHAKAEVYGDSLVNERICNALSLIEKIEYH